LRDTKSILKFLNLILSSFFRWWWAAITGAASLISLVVTPPEGLLISRMELFLFVFSISAIFFLTFALFYQGWILYRQFFNGLEFVGVQKNGCYGGDYVFLLDSNIYIPQGSVVELKRFEEDVEGPMALVEIMEKNKKDQYQGRPIWISPGHLRDLKLGNLAYSNIIAKPLVQLTTIQRARDQILTRSDVRE